MIQPGWIADRLRPLAVLPSLDWRSPRLPLFVGAALIGGSLLATAAAWLIGPDAPPRYADLPNVQGTMPESASARPQPVELFGLNRPGMPPPPLDGASPDPLAPPLDPDPKLLETIDGLTLPRVAEDGRRSRRVYARGVEPALAGGEGRAQVAVIVVDLGFDPERLAQSVALPEAIGLAHTPYAGYLPAWQRHARWYGHEVLLELPLQVVDLSTGDLGPWALDPEQSLTQLVEGLRRVIARGEGMVGLVAQSGAFAAAPERFAPIAVELLARGLGFVELGEPLLLATARANGVAYARANGPLDAVLDAEAIDAALARLEATAIRDGRALAYAQPFPLTFDRLWHWARSLDERGIDLVPVSRFLTRS